jgi:NAD(P)-dependent dehydrogenase (short-subunit alcohol dehydrogenase family)
MASAQIHARPGNVLSQSPGFALMWRGCRQRCRAALEYAPGGIRINAVCPGTIETPMVADMIAKGELDPAAAAAATPIGHLGQGEEIAASVLWLCSPGASFIIGIALPVDGGCGSISSE